MLETGQPYRPTPFPVPPRAAAEDPFDRFERSYAQFQAELARAHRRMTALVAILTTLVVIALLS